MERTQRVVAIIPARGGSKGIPRKNVQPVAGLPLIAHSIRDALASPLVDRVIVSTDDEEIAEVSRRHGAEVPFLRPPELAGDFATTESALTHAVEWLEGEEGYRVDIVVFLQPTDLFRDPGWITEAVRLLLEDPDLESAFVGYATHKNYWTVRDERPTKVSHRGYGPRQKKAPVYREDTGLACATRAALVRAGQRVGERVHIIHTDDFRTSIDIHDPMDLWLAEQVLARWGRPGS